MEKEQLRTKQGYNQLVGKSSLLLWMTLLLAAFACRPTEEPASEKTSITPQDTTDPLPSWSEGELKTAIVAYVTKVSQKNSPDWIPPEDRIATFDNDGTLWAEQPVLQGLFAFFRAKQMMAQTPQLKKKQPFQAIAEGDTAYLHRLDMNGLIGLVKATHTGMTIEAFKQEAAQFFATARHPARKVPVSQLVYQPQVELLRYLRANGFKTYICSGGTVDFMRSVSDAYYGIPAEQVIGSTFEYQYTDSAGLNTLIRKPVLKSLDDQQQKPVNIQYHIGKRPVFACGNERSGGDIYMLRFSQGNAYPSFQLLINHNDAHREFAYQEKDSISLKWAKRYHWHVVSMKDDWKTIFAK